MGYRSLNECVLDLEKHGELVRIAEPVDAYLEAAAIHRRVYAAGGPALLFENVAGCRFPMVSNLFGTLKRSRLMFRDTYHKVQRLIDLKIDPTRAMRAPLKYATAPMSAVTMLPGYTRRGPILENQTTLAELPRLTSWPQDGGPFVTLPVVYSEETKAGAGGPATGGLMKSNLGMYRVQIGGNDYAADEVGLHYQLHRSIGVHQAQAMAAGRPFHANVFVGGPPALALSAVMPLPEGLSELTFAGALGGRRVKMIRRPNGLPVYAEADFALCGTVLTDQTRPEGPFGDHLGYYALRHPFPVLRIDNLYHRTGAIWPFTVVGRPPAEDTSFGELIHDLTGPIIPTVLPGVKGVNAVDAAGVHPLLLAVGSERYMPWMKEKKPQELLTQACAILGQGQLSLAKYLWIANDGDDPQLDVHDIRGFFLHMLRRADWRRDLHFHTQTTIDTLDYSGDGFNAGSKVVVAAAGPPVFELATEAPAGLSLPEGFSDPRVVMPGVLAVRGPRLPAPTFDYDASRRGAASGEEVEAAGLAGAQQTAAGQLRSFCEAFTADDPINRFRVVLIVDDPAFVATPHGKGHGQGPGIDNFLWVAFTRSNPAADVSGIGAACHNKHWGCRGALVLDARIKPHHAPVVEEDPEVAKKVDALAAEGGPLHGLF
ncbi:MAG: UbiD family decarboxylase [Planctomycetota bacterium]